MAARNVLKNLRVKGYLSGAVTAHAESGAISTGAAVSTFDGTAGALAMTLADGATGQKLVLKCIEATNDTVVTPASFADGATLTFDTVGQYAELFFDGAEWQLLGSTATLA